MRLTKALGEWLYTIRRWSEYGCRWKINVHMLPDIPPKNPHTSHFNVLHRETGVKKRQPTSTSPTNLFPPICLLCQGTVSVVFREITRRAKAVLSSRLAGQTPDVEKIDGSRNFMLSGMPAKGIVRKKRDRTLHERIAITC